MHKKKLWSFVVRLFTFFMTSKHFVLFEAIFILKLASLLSKPFLVTNLPCFNLAVKFSAVNFLDSGVVINLSWLEILFSTSLIKNSCSH